ncbi:MAG: Gfo/Idh/MocA family oxidoreductase [Deinococcota bacterium]
MKEPLNVGVIGVGNINRKHMPGWLASEHAEVIAGADINDIALQSWGDEYGIRNLSTNVQDILGNKDIDIIDICTPNMYHLPLVIASLEAGKHVICEKPLAPTPADIAQMIDARDRSGKLLMTAQHFRFTSASRMMKQEIENGVLGDVYHARCWALRRNAFIPTPTFVHKKHSGGGAAIDLGVHILDLALWLMGNPEPVTVSGAARTELAYKEGQFSMWQSGMEVPKDWDVEEFANAFVRFENGATLSLEVSWLLHHDTMSEDMQIWLYGTDGGCHWPRAQFLSSDFQRKRLQSSVLQSSQDPMGPHAYECCAFAEAVAEGRPSPVPPEQSMQVMAILDGIYQSQKLGREITINTPSFDYQAVST